MLWQALYCLFIQYIKNNIIYEEIVKDYVIKFEGKSVIVI